jgi:hypothetical protein
VFLHPLKLAKATSLRKLAFRAGCRIAAQSPFFVDDGSGGEKAVFRKSPLNAAGEILINPWDGIADCAHFLSRCLTAGGLSIAERGVPSLVAKLQ